MRTSKYYQSLDAMRRNLRTLYKARSNRDDKVTGSAWYPSAHSNVLRFAERYGYSIATSACVVAAISPQCEWNHNLRIAEDILSGNPGASIGGALCESLRKARLIRDERMADVYPAFKSAPKVENFARNLQGIYSSVTVDTHAIQAALDNPEVTLGLKMSAYGAFARAYSDTALDLGLEPAIFQSVIWHTWKRLYPLPTKKRVRRAYAHSGV